MEIPKSDVWNVWLREKTSEKWQKAKDVSRAELFVIIDNILSNCKRVLRMKIIRVVKNGKV